MSRSNWISQSIIFFLLLTLFVISLIGSLNERNSIWLQVISTISGSVFSLYGGYLLALYLDVSTPNIELQKLGKGIGRGLVMVSMQLRDYAKEVDEFEADDNETMIRYSSIISQIKKIAENAEQAFMMLKDTFDLEISPSDLVLSVRKELEEVTLIENVSKKSDTPE